MWRPCVAVGAVPVLSKGASSGERGRRSSQVKTPHNPLDSSAPLMKKGKQRETPKAKKPTSLKKVCALSPWKQDTGGLGDSACLPATLSPFDFSLFWGMRPGHCFYRQAPTTELGPRPTPLTVKDHITNQCCAKSCQFFSGK